MADFPSDALTGLTEESVEDPLRTSLFKWSPSDKTPPFLTGQDPAPGAVGVSREEAIVRLDVVDAGVGVILSTILVEIDEGGGFVVAYSGATDSFSAPYDGPASRRTAVAGGHRIEIDRTTPYNPNTVVSVRVTGSDARGNAL
jgi:hypothetical protein